MKDFLKRLVDILFPPHADMVAARAVSEETVMQKLALRRGKGNGVYTGLPYRDKDIRALIRANKFHHCPHSAQVLAAVLFEILAQIRDEQALEMISASPMLIPIPTSPKRRRERGGNQVEWILDVLPKETWSECAYEPRLLARSERESQARIPRAMRRKNIRGAFFVPQEAWARVHGKHIILVDDVSESGATLLDAARALKEAGAKQVLGIALAK